MLEHVHMLVTEPERGNLAVVLQAIKQSAARREVKLIRKTHPSKTGLDGAASDGPNAAMAKAIVIVIETLHLPR